MPDVTVIESDPRPLSGRIPAETYYLYTGSRFKPLTLDHSSKDESSDSDDLYEVRIIDNDYNTYREVIDICIIALGVTHDEAHRIAWEVDHLGSCVVAHASRSSAEELANVIRTIGIEVQVNRVVIDE
jgi:ATP-dependent Clp protease adapter protein ClpS